MDLSASPGFDNRWTLGGHLGLKRETGSDPTTGLCNCRSNYTDYEFYVSYAFQPDLSLTVAETWTNANPASYTVNGYNAGGHRLSGRCSKRTFN